MVGEEDVEVSSYEDGSCSERSSISESEQSKDPTDSYLLIPYGFQSKAYYKANSKSKEITEGKKLLLLFVQEQKYKYCGTCPILI